MIDPKAFVRIASEELSRTWERKAPEEPFLWIYMLNEEGRGTMADLTQILKSMPDGVRPDQIDLVATDAINIITYEKKIKEAVLCHDSVTESSLPIVVFAYHGSLGRRANYRGTVTVGPERVAGREETVVYDRPRLGSWQFRVEDVATWSRQSFGNFRDLVPFQKIETDVRRQDGRWWVGYNDLFPPFLSEGQPNGFLTEEEARKKAREIEQILTGLALREINAQLHRTRVERCPLQAAIDYEDGPRP